MTLDASRFFISAVEEGVIEAGPEYAKRKALIERTELELNALEAQQMELLVEADGLNIALSRMQRVLLRQCAIAEAPPRQTKKRKTLQDPPPPIDAAHAARRRRAVAVEI